MWERKEEKKTDHLVYFVVEAEKECMYVQQVTDKLAECDQFTCGRERRSDFWAWHPFARLHRSGDELVMIGFISMIWFILCMYMYIQSTQYGNNTEITDT